MPMRGTHQVTHFPPCSTVLHANSTATSDSNVTTLSVVIRFHGTAGLLAVNAAGPAAADGKHGSKHNK
jgi:hypothetical protein